MENQEEHQPPKKKKCKLNSGFSVPLKKPDTLVLEKTSKPGGKTDAKSMDTLQPDIVQKMPHKKKKMKPVLSSAITETDKQIQKLCEIYKKRKKNDVKADTEILNEMEKKYLQAEQWQSPNMKDNINVSTVAKSKEKTKQKKEITGDISESLSLNDVFDCVLGNETEEKCEKKKKEITKDISKSLSLNDVFDCVLGTSMEEKCEKAKKKKEIVGDISEPLSLNDIFDCVLGRTEEEICEQSKEDAHEVMRESHHSKEQIKKSKPKFNVTRTEHSKEDAHRVMSENPHSKGQIKKSKPDFNVTKTDKDKCTPLKNNDSTELCTTREDDTESDIEEEEKGTWIQCSNKDCMKWRYLEDVQDPLMVPEIWDCTMNSDPEHNSCEKSQVSFDESNHIYTKFAIGSVVWAKLIGYPWWPAMVDCDPDTDTYFETLKHSEMVPFQFHVTFFDDKVTRSWVKVRSLEPYSEDELPEAVSAEGFKTYKKEVKAAMRNANQALKLDIKARVQEFGFQKRFSSLRSKVKVRSTQKKKHTKQQCLTKEVSSKAESPDYALGDISDTLEDLEYLPKTTTSRRKPFESKDQVQADKNDDCKSESELKTEKTDTPQGDEINLPGKSSKKDSCALVDDNNLSNAECEGKGDGVKTSIQNKQKEVYKKLIKMVKKKSPTKDEHDQNGKTRNVKNNDTGATHTRNESSINDKSILSASNTEIKHSACKDEKEIKIADDNKLVQNPKLKTSNKKHAVDHQKNETHSQTTDVPIHKKKREKKKKQKDYSEEVSNIGECLASTTNIDHQGNETHYQTTDIPTQKEINKKKKKHKDYSEEVSNIGECLTSTTNIPETGKITKKKKSVTKNSFDCPKAEEKLNENDSSINVEVSNSDTVTQSSNLEGISNHLINKRAEEITQICGEIGTIKTSRKPESICDNEEEEPSRTAEKEKYNRESFDPDTESIVGKNGKIGTFKKTKLKLKKKCQNMGEEEEDTVNKTSNESAESCTKKLSDEHISKSSEKINKKCLTDKKLGRKESEKGSDKIKSTFKLPKIKSMTKFENEQSKKTQFNSPDQKVTVEKILQLSSKIKSTTLREKNVKDHLKIYDCNEIENDHQIVPDIEAGTHDDSGSFTDLQFSDLDIREKLKDPASHLDRTGKIHDEISDEERDLDWDTESIKVKENKVKATGNCEDKCDEDSDDFILHLDTNQGKGELISEDSDQEDLLYSQCGGNEFYEF